MTLPLTHGYSGLHHPNRSHPTILLVQVRSTEDPMAHHERRCVIRRLAGLDFHLEWRNAITAAPGPECLKGVSAVIIGGSGGHSVGDPANDVWLSGLRRLLDALLERQIPSLGICFGHQVLGVHLGGRLMSGEPGAECGTVTLQQSAAGGADVLFGALGPSYRAHTGHTDFIESTPAGATSLATSDRLGTQAFRVRGSRFYSTQFHPDLTSEDANARYAAFLTHLEPHERAAVSKSLPVFSPHGDGASLLLRRFAQLALNAERPSAPARRRVAALRAESTAA